MLWYFKQLFPLTYWTNYGTNYKTSMDKPQFAIWRMWFGRCFSVTRVSN
jgi:hypothetical protein